MKIIDTNFVTRLLLWGAQVAALGRRRSPAPSSWLLLPPFRCGSLGDEAMMRPVVDFHSQAGHALTIIDWAADDWSSRFGLPGINLGQYLRGKSVVALPAFLSVLRQHDGLMFLGADIVDGYYSDVRSARRVRIVAAAAHAGLQTTIIGFSFNAHPAPNTLAALRALPASVRLCARDAISHRRVEDQLGRPVHLVADVAFLLEPETHTPEVVRTVAWIAAEQARGRLVVGVNVSHTMMTCWARNKPLDEYFDKFAQILTAVARASTTSLSFLFVPHDRRGTENDASLNARICARLPDDLRANTRLVPAEVNAREVKGIAGSLDLAIAARMHFVIACLGAGTPVAAFGYQDKYGGLYEHFGLDGLLVESSQIVFPDVVTLLGRAIETRLALRRQIQERLPAVRQLAARNLQAFRSQAFRSGPFSDQDTQRIAQCDDT